jgi:hypothetical protein
MSVYLGTFGQVELQRQSDGSSMPATIKAGKANVNVTAKRLSFGFAEGQLITGDKIQIKSDNGSNINFLSGYAQPSVKKFIYVDDLGGIRLYHTFAHAVNGGTANALTLIEPISSLDVKVTVANPLPRILAAVQSYELNTERETVDTTTLSDEFRSRISTLMSGSGRMSCEWQYTGDDQREIPNYLLQLVLRTKVGSNFHARFYIKTEAYNPGGVASRSDDAIWYDFDGIITACAMQFAPSQIVQITADFITTGAVSLRMNLEIPDKIHQEDGSDMLLDQDPTAKLSKSSDT